MVEIDEIKSNRFIWWLTIMKSVSLSKRIKKTTKNSKVNLQPYLKKTDLDLIKNSKKGSATAKVARKTINQIDTELVIKAKSGNIEARNYLFTKHLGTIKWILNHNFVLDPQEFHDREHDCFFIFLKAVDEYKVDGDKDGTTNYNFLGFLKMKICTLLINQLKSENRRDKIGLCEPLDEYLSDEHQEHSNIKFPSSVYVEDENFYYIDEGLTKESIG